jgi:hypothetical protein
MEREAATVAAEWIELEPLSSRTPLRPSQIVHENSPQPTTDGRNVVVVLERRSTGGTRHEAQFRRAAGTMSGAARKKKERVRASLFPQKQREARARDARRNRKATGGYNTVAAAARSDVTFNKSEAATAARAAEVPEKYWCNNSRKGTKLEHVQCVVCSRKFPMRADGRPWFHLIEGGSYSLRWVYCDGTDGSFP